MASAFPTLSPTASTVRKFFDAAAIDTISGNAVLATYPINERKGKARNCFIIVHVTLLEVHKTQKDFKNKKAAKHLVDFADIFNVSLQNEPIQIKDDCICLMDPTASFFIKPVDTEYDLQCWFDLILERARECRCIKLLRPVFREEFFEVNYRIIQFLYVDSIEGTPARSNCLVNEAAWDVRIVNRPRLRREKKQMLMEAQVDDLAEKKPLMLGHHRLCICPSSFLLFKIGCRPSASIDRPFEKGNFIDLSLNVISNYGTQEKYFFVRVGRCSEIGSGEFWMATEHGSSARAMQKRISEINQRESERRRVQGIKINLPTISSSVLKSRAHRERSQTQNMHKSGTKKAVTKEEGIDQLEADSRKLSHNSATDHLEPKQQNNAANDVVNQNCQFDTRSHQSMRVDSINCLQSIPERYLLSDQTATSSKKNSLIGLFASRIGAKMSAGSCGNPADFKTDQLTAPCSPSAQTSGNTFGLNKEKKTAAAMFKEGSNTSLVNFGATSSQTARNSLVSSVFGLRLTRRNSLTGAARNQPPTKERQIPSAGINAQPSYDCAEDYMTYDADERESCHYGSPYGEHSIKLGSLGKKVLGCALTRGESRKSNSSAYSAGPTRQFSTGSGIGAIYSDPLSNCPNAKEFQLNSGDYLEMDSGQNTAAATEPVFALHEVQSFISNSSESCWTPGSNNTNRSAGELGSAFDSNVPRAYSLGSRPGGNEAPNNSRPASSGIAKMPTVANTQLLHPSANGSPPNYLKKSILSQTVKTIRSQQIEIKNSYEKQKEDENKLEENPQQIDDLTAEVRKRAQSLGSKSWIDSAVKQFSAEIILKETQGQNLAPFEEDNSRRNNCGDKSMGSSSSCYPHSVEDHVEIDFNKDEYPSMDSIPSLHSRNSSVGVQCPIGVRSALDSLAHSRGLCSEKPAEKLIQSIKGRDNLQMKRKRSVPEMLQVQLIQSETTQSSGDRLHPNNRRSTMDSSALRMKNCHQKKSPPKVHSTAPMAIPATQSKNSGISSRTESSATTCEHQHKGHILKEEEDDDYVVLNAPRTQQKESQQQQPNVRSIETIMEFSPCSSHSSDGEGKKRGRLINQKKKLPVDNAANASYDNYSIILADKDATIPIGSNRAYLSASFSKNHSSSQSPHLSRRKLSSQQLGAVRSYFPTQRGNMSPGRRNNTTVAENDGKNT